MTAKEEPSGFYEQLPPEWRDLVGKAFEAMDDPNFTGKVYQETFTIQGNPVQIVQGIPSQIVQGNPSSAGQNYWIRWEYTPDEWKLFDRLDWGKAARRFFLTITTTALLYVGIVSLFEIGIVSSITGSDVLFPALFVPLMLLLPASLLLYFFAWLRFQEARRRHLARQRGPRRVTIGSPHLFDQDMWLAGVHMPLQELFVKLLKVKLSARPPLVLSLRRRHSITTGSGTWRDTMYVPVPWGHEDEARQLVERFYSEIIDARKRKNIPAEPE